MSRLVPLPNSSRLYIPSQYEEVIANVADRLLTEVGGYTASEGVGGYVNHDGKPSQEPVTVIEVFANTFGQMSSVQRIFQSAAEALVIAGEESVLLVVNGGATLVFA